MAKTPGNPRKVERRHHKVSGLPVSVYDELNERLKRGETYEHVEAWLVSRGHPIGKSSIHRHHKFMRYGMERIRERTLIAERIVQANAGADPSVIQSAAYQLAMQEATGFLMGMAAGDFDEDKDEGVKQLTKLMHALAAMGGTSTNLSKYISEQRKAKAEADRKLDQMTRSGDLPAAVADAVKKIYGITVEPEKKS